MKLLVVESSGKASLILDFIRKAAPEEEWQVVSCNNHYAGLSPKSLSLNVKKEFAPSWKHRDPKSFRRVKDAVGKATEVYAATDFGPDGEAIAFQVSVTAERAKKPFFRLRLPILDAASFSESVASPGEVDKNVFSSFLAREAVDRFVRFKLGPVMGERLGVGSLERIPSLLLTELARRERKVRRYTPTERWVVRALLDNGSIAESSTVGSEAEAEEIVRRCKVAEPAYTSASEVALPPPPFTTSTLLQFLSDRYGYLPSQSRKLCETLYNLGYITQPFTDSFFVADSFMESVRSYVAQTFGDEFLSDSRRKYVADGSSDRLEAIRPLDITVAPSKSKIRGELLKAYSAIWFNSIASQGTTALLERQVCNYTFPGTTDVVFSASGTRLASPGWHQLSARLFLPQDQELLEEGLEILEASALLTSSIPPSRHTASSLIAWLDEKAVGRPHNYASSISYLLDAGYAESSQGRIHITERGEAVLTFLKKAAPDLIDSDFHAEIEEEIDSVTAGTLSYEEFAQDYWNWTLSAESKMSKTSLRPRFLSPGGEKLRIWVDSERVWAFSRKEDYWVPVIFDERGLAVAAAADE